MKTVLLTTETTHHLYYTWKLSESVPLRAVLLEGRRIVPAFETRHAFEDERDIYERDVLLSGCSATFNDLTEIHRVGSMNDRVTIDILKKILPDVILIFGTGKISKEVIDIPSVACLNLHGGDPEQYRGLDTHLWAIYHRDFNNLTTTLHYVDAQLDTGDIVLRGRLKLGHNDRLCELRSINTNVCVDLSLKALGTINAGDILPRRKLAQHGRYYSFMPKALKDICLNNFEEHVARL